MPNCGRRRIKDDGAYQLLIDRFRSARSDRSLAVLEGFHSLKHALRFGANVIEIVTRDSDHLSTLAESLAPDLTGFPGLDVTVAPDRVFRQLSPVPPSTGVTAIARRPQSSIEDLSSTVGLPLVFLENPRSHGNIGAAIRVAAAAGAGGVMTSGAQDPWHPSALVGSAGLHFALPVAWLRGYEASQLSPEVEKRRLVAIDPKGEPLKPNAVQGGAILAFGTEREGLSPQLLSTAQSSIAIPMEPGVSSLNLATAVAVVLYAWKLG